MLRLFLLPHSLLLLGYCLICARKSASYTLSPLFRLPSSAILGCLEIVETIVVLVDPYVYDDLMKSSEAFITVKLEKVYT